MTQRLEFIFSHIPSCKVFADIGCDHGFIAKAMLDNNKCQRAIISDISEKSLNKAQKLLNNYLFEKKAESIVSDGFDNIPYVDIALIAGMGGEEIVKILLRRETLPKTIVLQPMRNCDKVRLTLLRRGYKIDYDQTFSESGKFYDLIVASVGKDSCTKQELIFGRTNLLEKGNAFVQKWKEEEVKLNKALQNSKGDIIRQKEIEELLREIKENVY